MTLPARFTAKYSVADNGCWIWTAALTSEGYGSYFHQGHSVGAHRVAYEALVGAIPAAKVLDHTCRNRACVNPEHLRPVTHKQNFENRGGANRTSASGVLGVDLHNGKWRAQIRHNGTKIHVGTFASLEAAEDAVIARRLELFTHNDADHQRRAA